MPWPDAVAAACGQRHVLDGVRAEDIAAELGCDASMVRAALRAASIPRLGHGRAQLLLADREWRRRRVQDAASIQRIADEVGCRVNTVRRALDLAVSGGRDAASGGARGAAC